VTLACGYYFAGAPTCPEPSETDDLQVCSEVTCGEYCSVDRCFNNFSSITAMEVDGWRFDWKEKYIF
jgi:SH3-like domain-containing protein